MVLSGTHGFFRTSVAISGQFYDTVGVVDLRTLAASVPAGIQLPQLSNITSMAVDRQRLFVGRTGNGTGAVIEVYDISNPLAPAARTAITGFDAIRAHEIYDLTVSGEHAFFLGTNSGRAAGSLYYVRLGSARDGTTARVPAAPFDTPQNPTGNLTIAGDLLYVRSNTGLATYDISQAWQYGRSLSKQPSVSFIAVSGSGSSSYTGEPAVLQIKGPFAYVLSDDYRVFDLR